MTPVAAGVGAVIADDEPLLRAQLRARLARLWPDLAIRHEMGNGRGIEELVPRNNHRRTTCRGPPFGLIIETAGDTAATFAVLLPMAVLPATSLIWTRTA